MSSSGHDKHGGKPGQRNRKAEQQRAKKPAQPQSHLQERQQDAEDKEQIDMAVASTEAAPTVTSPPAG